MKYQELNKTNKSHAVCRYAGFFLLFIFSAAGFPDQAASFRLIETTESGLLSGEDRSSSKPVPSPNVTDSCLPLLSSIRHTNATANSLPVTDRTQRSAGSAATLALVFGVRFALGPVEKVSSRNFKKPKPSLDLWLSEGALEDSKTAHSVTAYNRCRKEQALQALNDFRWER